jgi:L-iditol 2-dehydrogenase
MLHGPEDVRIEEIAEPDDEVVVEVEAATACGTDVKMWRHGHRILPPYPCRFGHETAGRRVDTGERVLVSDSVACGTCGPCRAGRAQICRRPTWVFGGFAERIAAPEAALHAVPDGLPAAAAAMAEPLAAAVHAVGRAGQGDDAGILGGGPMGQMLAALLLAEGRDVTLADHRPARRAQAAALGARAVEALDQHALVLEAAGHPQAWRAAVGAARPGGVVVLVGGCPPGADAALPASALHYDEIDVRGAFHHDRAEVDRALALLAAGTVDWEVLAGPHIGLEALPYALAAQAADADGPARKLVVEP